MIIQTIGRALLGLGTVAVFMVVVVAFRFTLPPQEPACHPPEYRASRC